MAQPWEEEEVQAKAQMVSNLFGNNKYSTWLILRVVGSLTEEIIYIGELSIETREEFIWTHLDEMSISDVVVGFIEGNLIFLFVLHWECVGLTKVSWVGHVNEEPLSCIVDC